MESEFLVGLAQIAGGLGISASTLTRWRKNHGLPVFRLPSGKPAISRAQLLEWCNARFEAQKIIGLDKCRNHKQYINEYRQVKADLEARQRASWQPGGLDARAQGG